MSDMISTLEELNRLYRELQESVFSDCAAGNSDAAAAVTDAILRHRNLMNAIEAAQSDLSAMTVQRHDKAETIDEDHRCRELAAAAFRQVEKLIKLCRDRALILESCLAAMREDLRQIENGARYLQSTRPAATPYPKFIDSVG